MFRTTRALIIAVVVAVSLLGSASAASADTNTGRVVVSSSVKPLQIPMSAAGITWE